MTAFAFRFAWMTEDQPGFFRVGGKDSNRYLLPRNISTQEAWTSMVDTSIKKVQSEHSPRGPMGQKYLATGLGLGMRLWEQLPVGQTQESSSRDYETIGYVIQGRAELQLEGQTILLDTGDCWVVPKGASHSYTILETFTAVEATHPPAHVHGRDEVPPS
jgi:quercetin dioxygenase-like cupin family protein